MKIELEIDADVDVIIDFLCLVQTVFDPQGTRRGETDRELSLAKRFIDTATDIIEDATEQRKENDNTK